MKVFKWTLGGLGALAVAGALIYSAVGSSATQAQEEDSDEGSIRETYQELLAAELNTTVEDLQAARESAWSSAIDQALAAGEIDEEQAERLKEHPGFPAEWRHHMMGGPEGLRGAVGDVFDTAAGILGLSGDELREALSEGQTLEEIAADAGVSMDDLTSGIISAVQSELDEAVANGDLAQERADSIAENLTERIENLAERLSGDFPELREHRFGGMPFGPGR